MVIVCNGCHIHIDTELAKQWIVVRLVKKYQRPVTYYFCSKKCMLGLAPAPTKPLEPAPKSPPKTNYLRIRLKKRKSTG